MTNLEVRRCDGNYGYTIFTKDGTNTLYKGTDEIKGTDIFKLPDDFLLASIEVIPEYDVIVFLIDNKETLEKQESHLYQQSSLTLKTNMKECLETEANWVFHLLNYNFNEGYEFQYIPKDFEEEWDECLKTFSNYFFELNETA